jgi:hypothetical protein
MPETTAPGKPTNYERAATTPTGKKSSPFYPEGTIPRRSSLDRRSSFDLVSRPQPTTDAFVQYIGSRGPRYHRCYP